MKKLWFVFCLLFVLASQSYATNELEVEAGVKSKWSLYTTSEELARNNPGMKVPVNFTGKGNKRTGFFRYQPVEEYEGAIVFLNGRLKTIDKPVVVIGEERYALHIRFILSAIVLMFLVQVALKLKRVRKIVAVIFVSIAMILAYVASNLASAAHDFPTALAAATTTLAAFVISSIVVSKTFANDSKKYLIANIVFYISAFTALFIDYIY